MLNKILDQYGVMGNPIHHSKSPMIHRLFAQQTHQQIEYHPILVPLDSFAVSVDNFRQTGGRGLNITVPFKREAAIYATELTPRARAADAVNTLMFTPTTIIGDNTDGVGLIADLTLRHQVKLDGARVLLLGAGGAARGVILPLLACQPAQLVIANRSIENAKLLGQQFSLDFYTFEQLSALTVSFDLIINATASGLSDEVPNIPNGLFANCQLAYDMMYGAKPTAFMSVARQYGVEQAIDGLGMLVEQAAVSFECWRGVRPNTQPVYQQLREKLAVLV